MTTADDGGSMCNRPSLVSRRLMMPAEEGSGPLQNHMPSVSLAIQPSRGPGIAGILKSWELACPQDTEEVVIMRLRGSTLGLSVLRGCCRSMAGRGGPIQPAGCGSWEDGKSL